MKILILVFIYLLSLNSYASVELQAGDVLLISFNCYECRVIESETNSKFSHSGVIVKDSDHNIRVAQSLGSVALYPLEQFTKNKTPGTNVSVYRPKQFVDIGDGERTSLEERMLLVFNTVYKGAPFDEAYKWNNFDSSGRELLYCSEFIAKFLDHFLNSPTVPYPLTYKKNEAFWIRYFRGVIPEGELGNSPSSFSTDPRFMFVGTL